MAKKQFKTESKRLLDLMVNSIYTHREIFLREIISNASDAIDKRCYLSLTDDSVGMNREDFQIRITADKEAGTLTVTDNGIGMGQEELENNLGVIAASGSHKFRQELEEGADVDIIGQFGVGFYSAFMVADTITVITRKQGGAEALCWQSSGADGYTIQPAERTEVGTDIIMHLKPDTEEEKYSEYLEAHVLRGLVRKYSDYIRWPIRMETVKMRQKAGTDPEKPEYVEALEVETLNSMVPLWQRKKSEVTREEYDQFYEDKFGDFKAPLSVIPVSAEGLVSYKALLYIPSQAQSLFQGQEDPGLQLYSAGVMIMDQCRDLLPEYLGFVRGVVDSPDLNLNISRELLQHDRQLKVIATSLEKKVRGELERLLREERETYESFYRQFNRRLKFGVMDNFGAKKDVLQDLLLFYSSKEKKLVTLKEYLERMPEGQSRIYYAVGDDVAALDQLPQAELVREKDMEILYLTDKSDSFLVDMLQQYGDKPFCSVADGDLGLESDEGAGEAEAELYKPTFDFCKEALGDKVDEVCLSKKLRSHPVCITSGEGVTFEMEKYFAAVQPEMGVRAKRILELNVEHPVFRALETARVADPEKAKQYAEILYNQAKLIAGLPIENPSAYTDLICSLMV